MQHKFWIGNGKEITIDPTKDCWIYSSKISISSFKKKLYAHKENDRFYFYICELNLRYEYYNINLLTKEEAENFLISNITDFNEIEINRIEKEYGLALINH